MPMSAKPKNATSVRMKTALTVAGLFDFLPGVSSSFPSGRAQSRLMRMPAATMTPSMKTREDRIEQVVADAKDRARSIFMNAM